MSEILIQRLINREKLFGKLNFTKDNDNVIYTDDEGFLTHMYDVRNFEDSSELEEHIRRNWKYFKEFPTIQSDVRDAFLSKKKVVHIIFNGSKFRAHLDEFLSDKENRDLGSDCVWNVALFYNQITQFWYRPVINTFFSFFTQKLTQLHENIELFVELYLRNHSIEDEMQFQIAARFSLNELDILNKAREGHSISIGGRLDLFNKEAGQLFEIKASGLKVCSQEWIIQTLTYSCLLDMAKLPVNEIFIVNVLKGYLYVFFGWGRGKLKFRFN